METVNTVSKILQSKNQDLKCTSTLLKNAITSIKELRNNFDGCKQSAIGICAVWKIEFLNKKARKIKRHFDDFIAIQPEFLSTGSGSDDELYVAAENLKKQYIDSKAISRANYY